MNSMKKFPDFFKMGQIRVDYGASDADNAADQRRKPVCDGQQRPRKQCTLSGRGKRNERGAAAESSAARDRAALAESTERDRASRTESPERKHTPEAKKLSTQNPPANEYGA